MIRLVIVAITVIGFLILSILIFWLNGLSENSHREQKEISSFRIIQAVFKFILWEAGTKVTDNRRRKMSQRIHRFFTSATTEATLISCFPTAAARSAPVILQERNGTISSSS